MVKKVHGNFGYDKSFRSFAPEMEDIKLRILMAAAQQFFQYGIRSVSMDDIANSLGMSKKTLYQHYADKDHLVDAILDGNIKNVQCDSLDCQSKAKNAVEEVFLVLDECMGLFRHLNPMVLHDLEKFHFKAYQKFRNYKEQFLVETVRANIERGIREELYRPDLNIDVLAKYRVEALMISFNVNVYPVSHYKLVETSEEILLHFVYGLVTIKGYKLVQKYIAQRNKTKENVEERK